jgi:hypothetical protein
VEPAPPAPATAGAVANTTPMLNISITVTVIAPFSARRMRIPDSITGVFGSTRAVLKLQR